MKVIKAEDTRSLEPFRDRIIEGDCLEVMKSIPGESIDMILCDLPYGTTQNKWDSIIDLDLLFTEYMRIIKPHGAIVLTSSGLFTAKLMLHAHEIYKYKIVWVKSKATNFLNAKKQPLRKYEDICVFYKAQPTYNPQMSEGEAYDKGVRKDQLTGSYGDFSPKHVKSDGSRYPTDIVYFKTAESEGAVYHPTQKPVELGRYLIRTYTTTTWITVPPKPALWLWRREGGELLFDLRYLRNYSRIKGKDVIGELLLSLWCLRN